MNPPRASGVPQRPSKLTRGCAARWRSTRTTLTPSATPLFHCLTSAAGRQWSVSGSCVPSSQSCAAAFGILSERTRWEAVVPATPGTTCHPGVRSVQREGSRAPPRADWMSHRPAAWPHYVSDAATSSAAEALPCTSLTTARWQARALVAAIPPGLAPRASSPGGPEVPGLPAAGSRTVASPYPEDQQRLSFRPAGVPRTRPHPWEVP
jgi:hypothetical protein